MTKPQKNTAAKNARLFGPTLDAESRAKLNALLKQIDEKPTPKKPQTLEQFRVYHGLDYQELALVIGASDRSHAWRMCVGGARPRWDYCHWIVEQLDGAVTSQTLTDLSLRK